MPIEIGPGIVIGAGITITNIDELYAFSSVTFTNATATGRSGPSLANCLSAYDTGTNPWLTDTSYFNVTSGIQYWTVPKTGSYTITAAGGQGGTFGTRPTIGGAVITGTFSLTQGEIIRILVGQSGSASNNFYGSGGGGSFVVRTPYNTNGSILVIAGGAAGINYRSSTPTYLTTAPGQAGNAPGNIAGIEASNGGGGGAALTNGGNAANGSNQSSGGWGGGGGGFFGNGGYSGTAPGGVSGAQGGFSWTNGGTGGLTYQGTDGGFGGGGAASGACGAGGGGYNGGTAGDNSSYGGGGGSYNSGTSQTNTAGANVGQGYVTITAV